MKKNLSALMLCLVVTICQAEVTISNLSESEMTALEMTIGKAVLDGGMIYFVSPSGEVLASDRLSNIRSIVFMTSSSDIKPVNQTKINIYPNPTSDYLIVEGVEDNTPYKIYDYDGRVMDNGIGNTIPVSNLTNGNYLLLINTQVVKFIKN